MIMSKLKHQTKISQPRDNRAGLSDPLPLTGSILNRVRSKAKISLFDGQMEENND